MGPVVRGAAAAVLIGGLAAAVAVLAEDVAAKPSPGSFVLDPNVGDALALARIVDRHGDAVVEQALAAPERARRLVGVRAAAHMRRPAAVLVGLCELLGSRDPELAPEASRAALAIAERAQAEGLDGQDMLPEELAPARAALAAALARDSLRPDIRHAAQAADFALAEAGVPAPRGDEARVGDESP